MKILLLSLAARGHAIADALARSSSQPEIISVSPKKNPGIAKLASTVHECDLMDFDSVLQIAKKHNPDFIFVAPDDPIGGGIVDVLEGAGFDCIAPRKSLAQLEASKEFTRNLLTKNNLDFSPKYRAFHEFNESELNTFIDQELGGNCVVKYDALKGGKGVKVSGEHLHSTAEAVEYARECIEECGRVVIEEKLIGVEFSLLSFASGEAVVHMPAVQDHKRAYAGDTGPNTGGMGTYSDANHSLPFLVEEDIATAKSLNEQIAKALLQECCSPYKGILYGGFIVTKNGVKLIEYNARFGDPEALNILPLLESDFVEICDGIRTGSLSEEMVRFANKATVCKYITPKSYPEAKDEQGEVISFPDIPSNARLYLGDVSESDSGEILLGGSRTAGIVGIADTIAEAEKIAEDLCKQVTGPVRHREDIGTLSLIQVRHDLLKTLRS